MAREWRDTFFMLSVEKAFFLKALKQKHEDNS